MIYISTTYAPDQTAISDILEQCKKFNITKLELGSNHCYEANPSHITSQYDFSYLVHNYFPTPAKPFVVNIASLDDKIYHRSVNHLFHAIDFCEEIGAKLYTFHPGFLTDPTGTNPDHTNYDFQFRQQDLRSTNYEKAFERMVEAVSKAVDYSYQKGMCLAIETEGSLTKRDHLLMQRPEEFKHFSRIFSVNDIGINLNIGHLRLAAKAFGFKKEEFVDQISNCIVAMELSHNDGFEDEHRPLQENAWYWKLICDNRFRSIPKILEFRDTPIELVLDTIHLCHKQLSL